jgi:hypothetical protein
VTPGNGVQVTNVDAGAVTDAAAWAGDAHATTNTAVASETAIATTRDGLMAHPSLPQADGEAWTGLPICSSRHRFGRVKVAAANRG